MDAKDKECLAGLGGLRNEIRPREIELAKGQADRCARRVREGEGGPDGEFDRSRRRRPGVPSGLEVLAGGPASRREA